MNSRESSFSLDDEAEGLNRADSSAHVRVSRRSKRQKFSIDLPDSVDTSKMEDMIKGQLQGYADKVFQLVTTQVQQHVDQQFTSMWSKSLAEFESRLDREKGSLSDPMASSTMQLHREAKDNMAMIAKLQ